MSSFLLISLLALDLPAFLYLKRRFFPNAESWQQAISLAHPPELTYHLIQGDWPEIIPHLRLPALTAACGSIFALQLMAIQALQSF
jgi:hypothetical protein